MQTVIVTGAAGFIGSALCRFLRANGLARVIGVDRMSYSASRESLAGLAGDPEFRLIEADINESALMDSLFSAEQPDGVLHLAAETHVDRSIDDPSPFIHNNIIGTFALLESARRYWASSPAPKRAAFRFLHVSTDEVYGSLGPEGAFSEMSLYAPNSPYAASKAGADHLARAWHKTYGLPVIISNCSNNYGPFQFPEKLIPLCLMKALRGEALPVYGQGTNVRDWLFVDDHAEALHTIFARGRPGEKYNVGGAAECRNIDLVHELCAILDDCLSQSPHCPHKQLVTFVPDRPGHDARYAMDFSKLGGELEWHPRTTLAEGLRRTVRWYLDNIAWCEMICARSYGGERLGLSLQGGTAA
ncbi:MAG: dTDP-glucose 4,6-dehydratase [Alphaproteobacteria bacterium]|nr:dTDP-glucose 4,6-dehydratase [Alphaproteobacteria bacterium]